MGKNYDRRKILMIDFNDEIYNTEGIKGILMQLTKHLLFIVIGAVLLALPCYLIGLLILRSGD
jgi:hypothetical protein